MTILERLLPSQDLAALLGDIVEESWHRSRLWYWIQVLAVLVVGSCREVRAHRLLTLRAIAAGIGALLAYVYLWILFLKGLQTLSYGFYIGNQWITVPNASLAEQRFIVACAWLLFLIGFSLSGWIVGRLHRQYGIAPVLPLAGLVAFLLLALSVRSALSPLRLGIAFNSALLLLYLTHAALIPTSIVLGGYWSTCRVRAA